MCCRYGGTFRSSSGAITPATVASRRKSKAAEQRHIAQGHRLFDQLVEALPSTRITLRLWAVDADDSTDDDIADVRPSSAGLSVDEPGKQHG
jgi:hypothetical protein